MEETYIYYNTTVTFVNQRTFEHKTYMLKIYEKHKIIRCSIL